MANINNRLALPKCFETSNEALPMNIEMFKFLESSIKNSDEFKKLALIGKHKIYHQEENALVHTYMVCKEASVMFYGDYEMQLVALLHDIGKIYTSVQHGPDDWTYPNHAKAGAEHLDLFIPHIPEYEHIKWYIANHIRPLYWRTKEDLKEEFKYMNCPKGCSVIKLAQLALCDINGSISLDPQTELKEYLEKFINEGTYAFKRASKYGLEEFALELINRGYSADETLDVWNL
jgi:hypothetical protein